MGVEDDYVAYCLDEAVGYLGTTIENELEQAGQKPSKDAQKIKIARERVVKKHFGDIRGAKPKKYADPAAFFE
jgi:hypothetical protein